MRRLFWVAVGVGTTVYVLRKVGKVSTVAQKVAPASLTESVSQLAASLQQATSEFRSTMAEQEQRLTQMLLPDEDTTQRARATRRNSRDGPGTFESSPSWGLDSDDPELYL